jgi:2-hydroxychromene-2-carboxylate isomerase
MTGMKLELFFDLSSPYSYLAATQVEALAARTKAELAWRPMVLHAVHKATGNDMPARVAAKALWMWRDLNRWAEQYGVPFKMSSHFPANTVNAMRLVLVADEQGKAGTVALACFRAMWVDDRSLADEEVLRQIAAPYGIDLAAIARQEIKDRLRANTDEAIARGAFGAPVLFVGDELFWGNDRLHHVEKALTRGES